MNADPEIATPYRIDYDRSTGILYLTVSGFWTIKTADRFFSEVATNLVRLRAGRLQIRALVDASAGAVQSTEVILSLAKIHTQLVVGLSDRLAIIAPTGLATLQAKRFVASDQSGIFGSVSDARAWLLGSPC